jgi:hypothetical protein
MTTLDRKYRDELLLALRLRDISGARVGEVLAEVEAYVAETGEAPATAFGTPKEYAAKVAAQLSPKSGKPSAPHAMAGALITGMLAYIGVGALMSGLWPDGPVVLLTMADVMTGIIFLALITTSILLLFRAAADVTRGKLFGMLGCCAFVAAIATVIFGAGLFDDQTALIELSPWVALGVGLVALAGAVYQLKRGFKHGRIVDPR